LDPFVIKGTTVWVIAPVSPLTEVPTVVIVSARRPKVLAVPRFGATAAAETGIEKFGSKSANVIKMVIIEIYFVLIPHRFSIF
jgi:hypothetical protein